MARAGRKDRGLLSKLDSAGKSSGMCVSTMTGKKIALARLKRNLMDATSMKE